MKCKTCERDYPPEGFYWKSIGRLANRDCKLCFRGKRKGARREEMDFDDSMIVTPVERFNRRSFA